MVDETTDDSIHKSLSRDLYSMFEYIQERRYSSLDRIGYTPDMVDQFSGKTLVKTDWEPDPATGYPLKGLEHHKIWSPFEWWVFNEWIKTDEKGRKFGIAFSPAQSKLADAWSDLQVQQIFVSGGRDSGKSMLGSMGSLWCMTFLNGLYPDFLVSLFAGAKEQTGTVYETHVIPQLIGSHHIKQLLSKYDLIHEIATGKKNRVGLKAVEMKFTTGARMVINPASTKAARSKHPDLLWLDEVVEAEDVKNGEVISGAVSSLTAGHMMRILGTSTVHKHPTGWFAQKIEMAQTIMQQGDKTWFYINLSEAGFKSKTWTTEKQIMKEFALKASDPKINVDAEFFGKVIDKGGDIFNQEHLAWVKANSPVPVYNPSKHHFICHDPGHGTSLYAGLVLQVDDFNVEILDGEFWYRASPNAILPTIRDWHEKYEAEVHAVDAAATGSILLMQDEGWDILPVPLGAKPQTDEMDIDQEERSMIDNKRISLNFINDILLPQKRFLCHPLVGTRKQIRPYPNQPFYHAGQLLYAQMEQYKENEKTGKPMKGNDDMIDCLSIGMKVVIDEGQLGSYAAVLTD